MATGLSSSSGAVYAGQIIMEGFVDIKVWGMMWMYGQDINV